MARKQNIVGAVYQQIAVDIAAGIVKGKYYEGQKIHGRSTLASLYNVSPETIRKAVYLLKDVGILDTERGSGIEVKSIERAQTFLAQYREIESVNTIKNEISQWAKRQREESEIICEKIQTLVDMGDRFKQINPFSHFELPVGKSNLCGKTISDLNFWHITGATIIGIKRGQDIILSPGPYAEFLEHDVFYIIGSDEAYLRAKKLLNGDE